LVLLRRRDIAGIGAIIDDRGEPEKSEDAGILNRENPAWNQLFPSG
jgi:hypothetical protein